MCIERERERYALLGAPAERVRDTYTCRERYVYIERERERYVYMYISHVYTPGGPSRRCSAAAAGSRPSYATKTYTINTNK